MSILKELQEPVGKAVDKKDKTPVPLTKEDKFAALTAVEKTLNKQFNVTGSLTRFNKKVDVDIPSIATNFMSLDEDVLGCGGIPRGRIIEVFGPESAGKTTVCLQIIAEEQANTDSLVAFVDAEHALNASYAAHLGVNMDELIISQPDSGEQGLETTEALIESGCVSLVVIDSIAALVPQAELDGEMGDANMGLQARLMSQACRKLRGIASINNVTLIFTNQIREKIGVMFGSPETTTGGRAMKFYATIRLDVRRRDPIKKGEEQIGHYLNIKAVKNKVGSPLHETQIPLIYGVGLDKESDLISYASKIGIVEKAGPWYKYKGENLGQGLENTIGNVKENRELFEKIKKDVKGFKK